MRPAETARGLRSRPPTEPAISRARSSRRLLRGPGEAAPDAGTPDRRLGRTGNRVGLRSAIARRVVDVGDAEAVVVERGAEPAELVVGVDDRSLGRRIGT